MSEPIVIFEPWAVVRVPFPYVERPIVKHRPALVVAMSERPHGLVWIMMITSARNQRWTDDVLVTDLALARLPSPSLIRPAKIATVDGKDCELLGSLGTADRLEVQSALDRILKPLRTIPSTAS